MAAPQSGAVEERGLLEFLIRQRACPDAPIRRTNCHVSRTFPAAAGVVRNPAAPSVPSCRASCFGASSYPYRHFRAVRRRDRSDWGSAWTIATTTTRSRSAHCSGFESPHGLIWRRTCTKPKRGSTGSKQPCRRGTFAAKHRSSFSSSRPRQCWPGDGEGRSCLAQDTLLDPSAGTVPLRLGQRSERLLILNEIDPETRQLGHIFPTAAITAHDGELIADLIAALFLRSC